MCGIAGIIDYDIIEGYGDIDAIVKLQRHRGPDDEGVWKSQDGYCVLGHNRLSVIDLSAAGHQPMYDQDGRNAIVYNGEIYNFQQLRKNCEKNGERFISQTDTEVILKLYNLYGIDCLKHLRGMFAFAIWDCERQRVFFARDRTGVKPLVYSVKGNRIFIASEIYALVNHPEINKEIDVEALNLYLQLQYIPAPWTIYKSIRKLPPAYYGVFDKDRLQLKCYWDIDYRDKIDISEEDAIEGLEEKIKEAVKLRMVADVPLGSLLSGGVDSSLIVALMSQASDRPVKTFSVGFREEEFNELPYAQQVADRYHTEHYPVIMDGNIHNILPSIVRYYGEPFADKGAIPAFYISRYARKHLTVALCGDGGDELLGGYPRYCLPEWTLLISNSLRNNLNKEYLVERISKVQDANSFMRLLIRKLYMTLGHPEAQTLLYAGFWSDSLRNELIDNNDESANVLKKWRENMLDGAYKRSDNPIDGMLWIDNHAYLTGDGMLKMDIASMHCSLEVRSPLVDQEVIEFCASLPISLKVRNRTGKYLLKKLAERHLPREIIYRKKKGFAIPVAQWLKGPLLNLLKECLNNPEIMEPLNSSVIRRIMSEFLNGNEKHRFRLWALLIYGLWKRSQ